MKKCNKFTAIIPARGGSKGLPRKNLMQFHGKPLLAWSIEAAKESQYLDAVYVSTEDSEISDVAHDYGAEVLSRPEELAADTATTIAVLQYHAQQIQDTNIVLLQPTSPIRHNALIDRVIRDFKESECDCLATGHRAYNYPWGSTDNTPRQSLEGWFHDDGNIYVWQNELLKKGRWVGDKPKQLIIERFYNYQIDDELDFEIASWIFERYSQKGG